MPKHNQKATSNEGKSVNQRLTELEEARQKQLAENGYKEFYTFQQGETTFEIQPDQILRNSKFGRSIARIVVNGSEYDWSISPAIELEVLRAMANGKNKLTLIRVGTGKDDTRYSLKA